MIYVPAIRGHPTNTVALTGYQVEGTPGRELLETGSAEFDGRILSVSAQVEFHEFSAHADPEGLRDFLEPARDSRVLVTHGDRCDAFAAALREDGYDADAPGTWRDRHPLKASTGSTSASAVPGRRGTWGGGHTARRGESGDEHRAGGETTGTGQLLSAVDVELLVEFLDPVGVLEFGHLLAEVLRADPDLHSVLLDGDVGFAIAVVTLHTSR